ncbi:MAG: hypothetical protein A2201_04710 [Alicyclobacillus sp. RIFOXYA1_FULL_53_8]|nr:MAG: hypothetical protein A2201_04710 [Alicyclobacillus sp. RIFOXYA1_FULL_53_8]
MQHIIEEVGLSRGAVYDYFHNKEQLFQAVIEQEDENTWERLASLKGTQPLWPVLEQYILASEPDSPYNPEASKRTSVHVEYVIQGGHDEERRTWLLQRYEKFVTALLEVLQAGVASDEFHPVLPLDVIVRFVLSANDGMNLSVIAAGSEAIDYARQTQALRDFLFYALRPKTENSPR